MLPASRELSGMLSSRVEWALPTLHGSTTGPKGRKYIARGEAPGKETKDNQPRRGDRKGLATWLVRLFFLKCIIVLITKTKRPASPSGLVLFYYLYRGLHPPLYPVGLSGLNFEIPIH